MLLAGGLSLTACSGAGTESTSSTRELGFEVVVEKNVPAAMRDGVVLRADIYRPDADGSFPALLRRTPYSKSAPGSDETFREMASRGYVVVSQDTRGRYASEGVAIPHDEADDGYDTVEWVASLAYVNGKVGMWGGSYVATTQLTAAGRAPPSLAAIAPSSSYTSRYDMVFQGGAFYLSDGLGWNLGQAADVRRRRAGAGYEQRDGPTGLTEEQRTELRSNWLWRVPLMSFGELDLRELAPGYYWMLEHPSYDDFWVTYDIGRRHDRFEVPALHTTGWYDTLLKGTLENFRGIREKGATERAREGQRLIVGPWTHSRPTLTTTSIGEVDFGSNAGLDYPALLMDWYDYWLRDIETGVMETAPVRLFVMGANEWRDEDAWPLERAVPTPYYLHSGGVAGTHPSDGRLDTSRPGDEPPDEYVYDPANPVPTGAFGGYSRSPADPTELERRSDVLVYTSEPLGEALEVTGYVELVLRASSSARDTDFTGKLIDVAPDGTARTLTDGILRARYRNGAEAPELLEPGVPTELRIDLLATSNVFLPGHRIRVEMSSSNFPRFDRNPNTGSSFATDAEMRTARQTIHHDAGNASYVLLPVVPGS
jgi:putative CocE/NonD family hydrolase